MNDLTTNVTSRRHFLAAAAGTVMAAGPALRTVRGAGATDNVIKVGLIGCGPRGSGAAKQALAAGSDVVVTALGDLFDENLQRTLTSLQKDFPDRTRVSPSDCYLGFDAFQRVIDSDVDVVILAAPPGFRPKHLKAAIDGGKHVFAEITAGVDAPGVRSILESSAVADKKGLSIVSGYCWRYSPPLRAAREQIQSGAIGKIRALYSNYYRMSLGNKHQGERDPKWSDLEWQIRNWHKYSWLSGDVTILCSGGHSVDKMSWWMNEQMPTRAVAVGGRQFPDEGNTFDHVMVAYEYADGIRGFLGCRDQTGCHTENADYIIGSEGECTIGRGRTPKISGKYEWKYTGPIGNMYQIEHDELFASIRARKPINDGHRMARTTLMAVMGRMAAYTGKEITWEQALESKESLVPDQIDWGTKVPLAPLAVPGVTKFV